MSFSIYQPGLIIYFRELYKLLDEKDEEIHIVTRLNEQLKGIFCVLLHNNIVTESNCC